MMHPGKTLIACALGLGMLAEAAPAFSMPAAPAIAAPAEGAIVNVQWGPPPGPGWGPPPPPRYHRPPPPPGWGPPPPRYRPPPPPPGWGPPPGYYRPAPPPPRHYRPRPRVNAHVEWCLDRYRSYNPATNRYLSSSGYYRVCVSPYSR